MITYARLLELLHYNPETGIFTWRKTRGKMRAGERAGGPVSKVYRHIMIDYQYYTEHRLAWFYVHKEWPDLIDHRDHMTGSVLSNLRVSTHAQNRYNSPPKIGHSKWKGVTFDAGRKKCWKMAFKLPSGKTIQARYEGEREAAEEYMFLALEHHGEFARFE